MNLRDTRRAFLLTVGGGLYGAAAAKAACFSGIPANPLKSIPNGKAQPLPAEGSPQPRLSLSTPEGKAQLDALMHAYDEMLCRDPKKDPTSLFYQMWLHDLYCNGSINVHSNWAFLPWHRAFLYFHERILRKILGDSFRLPVWDWDNDEHVPAAYDTWAAANVGKHAHADLNGQVNACSIQAWLFSSDYEGFAGYKPFYMVDGHAPAGTAPVGLHSFAHGRIGGVFGPTKTAAADPIFYAHHANVDRFWIYWRSQHPDFQVPDQFGDRVFCFYDENGAPYFVQAGDLLDERRLGYYYAKPPAVPGLGTPNVLHESIKNAKGGAAFFGNASQKLRPSQAVEDVTLPIKISWKSTKVTPGQYYLIAIKPATGDMKTIAGFGVFGCHSMHGRSPITATGCLKVSDIGALFAPGAQLVYGPADGNDVAPDPYWPIWPAEITILHH